MRIIIIGDGKVGYNLAESLSTEGHSIIIIDKNAEKLQEATDNLDVQCVKGNGLSTKVLLEAGVREADLLIAVTNSDEMNMVCCLTAKKLGAKHTIARIRDPEYADELSQLKNDLELDMVINPERAAAREIAKLVEFPSAISVETFARGRVEMVEIQVTGDMPIVGLTLKEVAQRISSSVLIGAVLRDGDVQIPDGSFTILENDMVYIIGQPSRVFYFCTHIGMHLMKIKQVMIVGGGNIAYYFAKYIDEIGMKVKIIEADYDRCSKLSELLPNALIIHGNGADDKLLRSENIGEMECLVSVTNSDEENFMVAFFAKRSGVPKVIARIDHKSYSELNHDIGIDNLLSPKDVIAEYIFRYVRGLHNAIDNPVNTLYRIIGGQAEVLEFTADDSAKMLGIPLKKLKLAKDILVGIIVRNNTTIIPHGNDIIKKDDSVILITKGQALTHLNDMLTQGSVS